MQDHERKYSLSMRVNQISPVHTRFQLFSGYIPREYAHEDAAGRGGMGGELTLRHDEFIEFTSRLNPHLINFLTDNSRKAFHENFPSLVETFHEIL